MNKKVNRLQFQCFIEHHFSQAAHEHVGERFLKIYFPGLYDPDIVETINDDVIIDRIQDRYVEQHI